MMKILAKLLDFVYGIILIGGTPLAVCFLPSLIADICGSFVPFTTPVAVVIIITSISMLAGFAALWLAIRHRARHRIAPRQLEFVEVAFGIILALFFFGYYGVIEHSIID